MSGGSPVRLWPVESFTWLLPSGFTLSSFCVLTANTRSKQDPQTCTFSPFHSFSHMTTWWPPPELVLVVLCHGQIFPVCLQCSVSQPAEIKAGAPVHPDRPILNHSISIGGLSHLTSCLALWMRPDLNAHRNLLLKQLFPHYPPSKRHKETENGTWSSWVIGRLAH